MTDASTMPVSQISRHLAFGKVWSREPILGPESGWNSPDIGRPMISNRGFPYLGLLLLFPEREC